MNNGGRIVACGMVSQYNLSEEKRYEVNNLFQFVTKQFIMEGEVQNGNLNIVSLFY
jgi:NADPH-dependent curcumin reductase CurA